MQMSETATTMATPVRSDPAFRHPPAVFASVPCAVATLLSAPPARPAARSGRPDGKRRRPASLRIASRSSQLAGMPGVQVDLGAIRSGADSAVSSAAVSRTGGVIRHEFPAE
jgi:hypothetical protein